MMLATQTVMGKMVTMMCHSVKLQHDIPQSLEGPWREVSWLHTTAPLAHSVLGHTGFAHTHQLYLLQPDTCTLKMRGDHFVDTTQLLLQGPKHTLTVNTVQHVGVPLHCTQVESRMYSM